MRILFVHVPTVWLGMAGWTTIAVASLVELVWRHPLAGLAARGAAVPGAVFTAIGLATGSIWGRPAWGTWWVWDGRLTSFLVLLFLYFGYIGLAGAVDREGGSSRIPAIFGLVGAVNIPIIHYSVTVVELAAPAAEHHRPAARRWPRRSCGAARGGARLLAAVRRGGARADARSARHRAGRGAAQAQGAGGLMREALDQWNFVIAAYAVTVIGTLLLVGWSWLAMRAAEKRREEGRRK